MNKSPRPKRSPRRIPDPIRAQIANLRRQRWPYHAIAHRVGVSKSTVARILKAQGLNRLSALEPKPPPRRFEVEAPGVLLHLDTKRLARFQRPGHRVTGDRSSRNRSAGWEYVFAAVDGHSRVAFGEVKANKRKESAVSFLLSALRHYRRLGVQIRAVMTDNARVFQSKLPEGAAVAGYPAQDHAPLHPEGEREGRALHPHPLERVGVRPRLPQPRGPGRVLAPVASLLQLAPPSQQPGQPDPRLTFGA